MEKYFNEIRKCPLFNGIADNDLSRMLHCFGAKTRFYNKKATILAEGGPAKDMGIVLSGSVHTIQTDYFGNRSIISKTSPSEMFAEAFACAEVKSIPASMVAAEDSEIMLVDCDHILHTCQNNCGFHQRLIYNLMKDLAQKSIESHQRIEITSKRTTREKLLAYLALCAKKFSSNSFTIPFNRQELADYLEVDRSGLSAEIGKLRKEGVLMSQKNKFTLLKGDSTQWKV